VRIVVIQTGGFEHFLAATTAVRSRYPGADVIGVVREADLRRAACSGQFVRLIGRPDVVKQWVPWELTEERCQLCVIPFASRLGVYYWHFRRMPLQLGIPTIASFNRCGVLRFSRPVTWALMTLCACVVLRSAHASIMKMWGYVRRWMDVALLFTLAGVALAVRALHMMVPRERASKSHSEAARGRVVLFIPSLGVGGAQRQLVSYLSHLDRTRWEPEVVTVETLDKFFEPEIRRLGVPITFLNPNGRLPTLGVLGQLVRHLHRAPCEVLHSWLHYAAMVGAVAGALTDTPVIIGSFRSERPARFPWFYPKWQRGIDILTAPLHTALIANSDAVRLDHRRWSWAADSKLLTIYNGIDPIPGPSQDRQQALRVELDLPYEVPLVGIVGRLSLEKDHRTFLDAARFVLSRRPETRFLIVGDGVLRGQIEADIHRWGLTDAVIVLGERRDVLELIRRLDVLVLTSRSEGFPNVLLEAAAVGTAVVTTAAGGAAECVEDGRTGFVVPCRNSWAVGERVLQLLVKPDLRTRFAEAGKRRAETVFAADQAARAMESCYRDGLDRSGRRPIPSKPVRVCLISPHVSRVLRGTFRAPVGGAEIQLARLASTLSDDARFAVTVVTGNESRVGRERVGRIAVVYTTLFGRSSVMPSSGATGASADEVPPGGGVESGWCRCLVDQVPASIAAPLRWLVHRGREMREIAAWWKVLGSLDADLYVMQGASPQVAYVRLASAILRRKFIYGVASDQDVHGGNETTQGVWGRRFEWGLRHADAIVCQHGEQIMQVRRRYGRGAELIRSFCPVEVVQGGAMPRTFILWMARLDDWKQPSLFVDLAERFPHEMFLMVGPPSDTNPNALAELGGRMGALPNFRFEPGVPFEETSALFAQAKLFVNTSRGEGFPNTFLQAAVAGTPIISWSVNPDGLLTRYQMGICANGDQATFEQALRDLCGDVEFRVRMGENGRKYVARQHAAAPIGGQYADLLLGLAGRWPVAPSEGGAVPATEETILVETVPERKSTGARR
jgi:glycosyltransferase involved in cell wall biosynthesis